MRLNESECQVISQNIETIYQSHIKPLSIEDRLKLIELIAREAAVVDTQPQAKQNDMDFHGSAAGMWGGVDAQEYVNELRDEWDEGK